MRRAQGFRWTFPRVADLVFILAYAALTFLFVTHHEPWRDEAQAWLLAKNAGLWDIITHYCRYEQHPSLWYLLLAPFAKIGLPYFSMQVIHWAIAVAIVALVLFKAPFPRWLKYPFVVSYLMMHEYVVIARDYNIAILLMFLIALCYAGRFKKPVLYGALVVLLFQTNFLVFTAAASLFGMYLIELAVERRWNAQILVGVVLMAAAGGLALWQGLMFPLDHPAWHQVHTVPGIANLFHAIGHGFFATTWDVSESLAGVVGIAIMALAAAALIRRPKVFLIWLGANAGLMYILTFRHEGSMRHYGFFLINILFALWLAYGSAKGEDDGAATRAMNRLSACSLKAAQIALALCLLLTAKYNVWANTMEMKAMFSGSKAMAQAIEKIIKEYPIISTVVAHPATQAASVKAHLPQHRFWYADLEQEGTYWIYNNQLDLDELLTQKEIIARSTKGLGTLNDKLLLLSHPLTFSNFDGYAFRLLFKVDQGVWGYGQERYYLYKPVLQR